MKKKIKTFILDKIAPVAIFFVMLPVIAILTKLVVKLFMWGYNVI